MLIDVHTVYTCSKKTLTVNQSTYALMGSYGLSACTGYVSALLMIFCVSYNMKPPKITNPPYVAIDWRPAPTTEVAGRNKVPGSQTHC